MKLGGCLCGAVRYQLHASSTRATHCHCRMCRKQHGAAFATYANFARDTVEVLDPGGSLAEYRSSPKVVRRFCRVCGSSLFWSRVDAPEKIAVAMGTLDDAPDREPEAHIFVKDKAPWVRICDDLPQYD